MTNENTKVVFESSHIPERNEPSGPVARSRGKALTRFANYFVRHWRGGFSLGFSFWVNGLLALFSLRLLSVVQEAVPTAWYEIPGALRLVAAVWTLFLGIWVVLQIWSNVGIWRSATRHRQRGGRRLWAHGAQLFVVIATLLQSGGLVMVLSSPLSDFVKIAFGRDPHGHAAITVSSDGKEIIVSGTIGEGFAAGITRVLNAGAGVRTVRLSSPGGRFFEATAAAKRIRASDLDTRADGPCYSACAILFVAGRQRSLATGAVLAFHRPSFPGTTPTEQAKALEAMSSVLRDSGIAPTVDAKIRALREDEIWFPNSAELVQYKLINQDAPTP
jgi:hypothetical protein